MLLFVRSICFSFFSAQLFDFGNRLEIVDFLTTKKTKGDMFEPGTNHRPVFFHFDFHFRFSIMFGHALTIATVVQRAREGIGLVFSTMAVTCRFGLSA